MRYPEPKGEIYVNICIITHVHTDVQLPWHCGQNEYKHTHAKYFIGNYTLQLT